MPVERSATTYADVAEMVRQRRREYGGDVEFKWTLQKPWAQAAHELWSVAAIWSARAGVHAGRVYVGECNIGGGRGATSAPGAMLRALMEVDRAADRAAETSRRLPELARLPDAPR